MSEETEDAAYAEGEGEEGMSRYCTHTNNSTICDACMGRTTMNELWPCADVRCRAKLEAMTQEVAHYRNACASVGETDGHGWAETTKELRQQLAASEQRVKELESSASTTKSWEYAKGLERELVEAQATVTAQQEEIKQLHTQIRELSGFY